MGGSHGDFETPPLTKPSIPHSAQGGEAAPQKRPQSKFYVKPDKAPLGYEEFYELNQMKRLNQVTESMKNKDLPKQIQSFYKAELFNRDHWDVTRNNMANALVWQENPDPNLHRLFIRMLEDKDEDPVWRDYCLQFLSECLRSSSGPELVKSKIREYSLKTGTATVHLAYQESEGVLQLGHAFSKQLADQLKNDEVTEATKVSILGVVEKRKDRKLQPLLREYAKQDENANLKRTATASLGLIGDPEDEPLIRSGLTHRNRAVQMAAKAALKRIAPETATEHEEPNLK